MAEDFESFAKDALAVIAPPDSFEGFAQDALGAFQKGQQAFQQRGQKAQDFLANEAAEHAYRRMYQSDPQHILKAETNWRGKPTGEYNSVGLKQGFRPDEAWKDTQRRFKAQFPGLDIDKDGFADFYDKAALEATKRYAAQDYAKQLKVADPNVEVRPGSEGAAFADFKKQFPDQSFEEAAGPDVMARMGSERAKAMAASYTASRKAVASKYLDEPGKGYRPGTGAQMAEELKAIRPGFVPPSQEEIAKAFADYQRRVPDADPQSFPERYMKAAKIGHEGAVIDEFANKWEERGALKKGVVGFWRNLPFSPVKTVEILETKKAFERIEKGEASPHDYATAGRFVAEAREAKKAGNVQKVWDTVVGMGGFAGEILATGGLYSTAKAGIGAGIARSLGSGMASRAAQAVVPRIAGVGIQAAGMPTRIAEATVREATDKYGLSKDEAGNMRVVMTQAGKDLGDALAAGYLDTFIELGTEKAGGMMSKQALRGAVAALPKPLRDRAIQSGIISALSNKAANSEAKTVLQRFLAGAEGLKKAGIHNPFQEFGEERLGDLARGLTGLSEDFGPLHVIAKYAVRDPEKAKDALNQLAVEGMAFLVPGLAGLASKSGQSQREAFRAEGRQMRADAAAFEAQHKEFLKLPDVVRQREYDEMSPLQLESRRSIERQEAKGELAETYPEPEIAFKRGEIAKPFLLESNRDPQAQYAGLLRAVGEAIADGKEVSPGLLEAIDSVPDAGVREFFREKIEEAKSLEAKQKTAAGPKGEGFTVDEPVPAYEGAGLTIEQMLAAKKAGIINPVQTGVPGIVSGAVEIPAKAGGRAPNRSPATVTARPEKVGVRASGIVGRKAKTQPQIDIAAPGVTAEASKPGKVGVRVPKELGKPPGGIQKPKKTVEEVKKARLANLKQNKVKADIQQIMGDRARQAGLGEEDIAKLPELVKSTLEEENGPALDYNGLLKGVRSSLRNMEGGAVSFVHQDRIEDPGQIKNLDVVAQSAARERPEFFKHDKSAPAYGEQLFRMLKDGNRPLMSDWEAWQKTLDRYIEEASRAGQPGDTVSPEEVVRLGETEGLREGTADGLAEGDADDAGGGVGESFDPAEFDPDQSRPGDTSRPAPSAARVTTKPKVGVRPLPRQSQESQILQFVKSRIAESSEEELRDIVSQQEQVEGAANPNMLVEAAEAELKKVRAGVKKRKAKKAASSKGDLDIELEEMFAGADLSEQAKAVLLARSRGDSLDVIGKRLGMTRENVRLIEKKALKQLGLREGLSMAAIREQLVDMRKADLRAKGKLVDAGDVGKGELAAVGNMTGPTSPTGTGEKVSRHEIIREAARKFKANVRWKRVRQWASGVYKRFPEVLRLAGRQAGNLGVFSHELAHDISKKHGNPIGGATPKAIAEVENMDYDKTRLAKLSKIRKATGAIQRIANRTQGQDARLAKLQAKESDLAELVREEGWAEFFRHWVAVGDASFHAPQFDAYFSTWLNKHKEVAENMEWLRGRIDAWKAAGPHGRLVLSETGEARRTIAEKAADFGRRLKKGIDDRFDALKQLEKAAKKRLGRYLKAEEMPYVLARILGSKQGARAAYAFQHGVRDDVSGKKLADGLAADLAPLADEQRGLLDEYLVAAQAKERWEKRNELEDRLQRKKRWQGLTDEEQAQLDNLDEPGVDYDDAKKIVEDLEAEYEPYAKKFRRFHRGLIKMLTLAGYYSAKEGRAILQSYKFYSPMMRVLERELLTGEKRSGAVLNIKNPVHLRTGGDQQIISPLRMTAVMAEQMFDTAAKTHIAKAIKNLGDRVEGMGDIIEKVEGRPSREDNTVKLGDDTYWIRPDLYKALMDTEPFLLHPTIEAALGAITKAKKAGAVGLRPGFGLIFNPIRDLASGMIRTKTGAWRANRAVFRNLADAIFLAPAKQGLRTLANLFYRLPKSVLTGKLDPIMDLHERFGGGQSGFYGQEVESGHKKIVQFINEARDQQANTVRASVVLNPWQYVKAMMRVFAHVEAAPRLAEIEGMLAERGITRKMLESGYDVTMEDMATVALAGQEVTQDFNRGGNWMMGLNKVSAFANAGYQGLSQFAQAVKDRPGTIIARGLTAITLPSLMLWFAYKDDDRWKELPWWLKFNFWNFFGKDPKDKKAWSIPMPHEIGTMFAALPMAMADAAYQEDPKTVKEWFKNAFPMLSTPSAWVDKLPDAMHLPIELYFAHSLWRNRDLMNEDIKRREPFDQHHSYTTSTAQYLGWLLSREEGGVRTGGLSPILIDHAISELSGGLGTDIMRAKDQGAGKLLGYGRLERDISEGQSIDDFYDEKNRVDRAHKTAKGSGARVPAELEARYRKFDKAADAMSALRKKMREGKIGRQAAAEQMTGIARDALGKPALAAYSK